EALAVELRGPVDDGPVRVAEDDPRAHADELVDEEEAVLEHLLEDEDRPPRLGRDRERDRGEVGRERWPRPVLDLRYLTAEIVLDGEDLAVGDEHARLLELELHAEALEG